MNVRSFEKTCLLSSAVFVLTVLSLCGCKRAVEVAKPEPPKVVVAHPEKREVQFYFTTDGIAEANEYTTITARISGELQQVCYEPGAIVFTGDPLFRIEPDQYKAQVEAAKASLASAVAQRDFAKATVERNQPLVNNNTITPQEFELDEARLKMAEAKISECQADLKIKELDLNYTEVKAPISGKTDTNFIDIGNLVGTGAENSRLTTIANLDPIFVYFDVSGVQASRFREIQVAFDEETKKALEKLKEYREKRNSETTPSKTVTEKAPSEAGNDKDRILPIGVSVGKIEEQFRMIEGKNYPVSVALSAEAGAEHEYKFHGVIDMTANKLDPNTQSIKFRAIIPNEKNVIYPGQAVYVRIPTFTESNAVVIRDEAIGLDMNRKYVFVVDAKNVVDRREIKVGPLQEDGTRVVFEGLTHEDRYIVQGTQKARRGQPVKIIE